MTPLHRAARYGSLGIMEAMRAAGSDLNAEGGVRAAATLRPVHIVIYRCFYVCAQNGMRAVHYAAADGQVAAVEALRAAGADMSVKDGVRTRCVMHA